MRRTLIGVAALAAVAIGCSSAPDKPAPANPVTISAQPTVARKAGPATVGPGTWEVPREVKPGTYTTNSVGPCYWARLKNFNGELDSVTANGNLNDGQRGRITVKATDKGLELSGDCVWTRTGA